MMSRLPRSPSRIESYKTLTEIDECETPVHGSEMLHRRRIDQEVETAIRATGSVFDPFRNLYSSVLNMACQYPQLSSAFVSVTSDGTVFIPLQLHFFSFLIAILATIFMPLLCSGAALAVLLGACHGDCSFLEDLKSRLLAFYMLCCCLAAIPSYSFLLEGLRGSGSILGGLSAEISFVEVFAPLILSAMLGSSLFLNLQELWLEQAAVRTLFAEFDEIADYCGQEPPSIAASEDGDSESGMLPKMGLRGNRALSASFNMSMGTIGTFLQSEETLSGPPGEDSPTSRIDRAPPLAPSPTVTFGGAECQANDGYQGGMNAALSELLEKKVKESLSAGSLALRETHALPVLEMLEQMHTRVWSLYSLSGHRLEPLFRSEFELRFLRVEAAAAEAQQALLLDRSRASSTTAGSVQKLQEGNRGGSKVSASIFQAAWRDRSANYETPSPRGADDSDDEAEEQVWIRDRWTRCPSLYAGPCYLSKTDYTLLASIVLTHTFLPAFWRKCVNGLDLFPTGRQDLWYLRISYLLVGSAMILFWSWQVLDSRWRLRQLKLKCLLVLVMSSPSLLRGYFVNLHRDVLDRVRIVDGDECPENVGLQSLRRLSDMATILRCNMLDDALFKGKTRSILNVEAAGLLRCFMRLELVPTSKRTQFYGVWSLMISISCFASMLFIIVEVEQVTVAFVVCGFDMAVAVIGVSMLLNSSLHINRIQFEHTTVALRAWKGRIARIHTQMRTRMKQAEISHRQFLTGFFELKMAPLDDLLHRIATFEEPLTWVGIPITAQMRNSLAVTLITSLLCCAWHRLMQGDIGDKFLSFTSEL